EIIIILKSDSQRTQVEKTSIKRGLKRSLIMELLLFVPVSVLLLIFITPAAFLYKITDDQLSPPTLYAFIGMISYGFPFSTIKTKITNTLCRMLRESAPTQEEQKTPKSRRAGKGGPPGVPRSRGRSQ